MKEIDCLNKIMKTLRGPGGCPWDRAQTHESLAKCLQEEAAEYLDAVEDRDDPGMCEELGDLLMQIVLHAAIASERGAFTLEDVARSAADKMIRRHPHVFGKESAANPDEVVALWEKIKKKENPDRKKSAMDGIPRHLAFLQAGRIQKRASELGFDWPDASPIPDKIQEELDELRSALSTGDESAVDEETGDLLFTVVNFIRKRGRDPEKILEQANSKFAARFRIMENLLAARGKEWKNTPPEELEELWKETKKNTGAFSQKL